MELLERPGSITSSIAPPGSIREGLRSLLPSKEKVSPALKHALELLRLRDIEALENHFLGTSAFLRPWASFRDYFLLQPQSAPRASAPGQIRGIDILWFYTNFLEGELRYDPRADHRAKEFTTDEKEYGKFDTSHWGVEEYEKFMYAWMLQEFKVGKSRNPFGFRYFECRNVCTAWKDIFVPIVTAVRDSYDTRGRRHYGRIASFIEEREPSRLASLEGNLPEPNSATPFRLVSFRRGRDEDSVTEPSPTEMPGWERPMRVQEYDEVETELKVVYRFGRVIERPDAKTRTQNWIAGKLEHNELLKKLQGARRRGRKESPDFGCQGIDSSSTMFRRSTSLVSHSSGRRSRTASPFQHLKTPSTKPVKAKESLLPYGRYGTIPKSNRSPTTSIPTETWKSTPNGISHPFNLPPPLPEDDNGSHSSEVMPSISQAARNLENLTGRDGNKSDIHALPIEPLKSASGRERRLERYNSDGLYSNIRRSNPFTDEPPSALASNVRPESTRKSDVDLPMYPLSAVPNPLSVHPTRERSDSNLTAERRFMREDDLQHSNYEEKTAPSLIARRMDPLLEHNAYSDRSEYNEPACGPGILPSITQDRTLQSTVRVAKPSQLLGQVHPAQRDHLEVSEIQGQTGVPQAVPWPGQDSPSMSPPFIWQKAETSLPPPVPLRNPMRLNSMPNVQDSGSPQQFQEESPIGTLGPRIISKENIRARLGIPHENSEEDLQHPATHIQADDKNPSLPPGPWNTFNDNPFPRQASKRTSAGGCAEPAGHADGGDYEAKMLRPGK